MREAEPSRTSMMAAIGRGLHRQLHAPPWVLDDPYALSLVGPAWREIYEVLEQAFPEPVRDEAIALMCARSRHAEDRLIGGGFGQYVVLGAGLDSFAWRRPDLLHGLRVFEVDHPSTQAWKQERVAALALPDSDSHVFVPVDFETQTLRDGLDSAGFEWAQPALFSWLGVTAYLTRDAVTSTLRSVAGCAPGSEVVFSYAPDPEFLDDLGREYLEVMVPLAEASGEPIQTMGSPADAESIVTATGLLVAEHLTPAGLNGRLFAGRPDGLTASSLERLLVAAVPA